MKYVFTTVYTRDDQEPLATVAMPIVPLLRLKHCGVGKATVYALPDGSKILWDHEGEFDPETEGSYSDDAEVQIRADGKILVEVWTPHVIDSEFVDTDAGWDGPALCFVVPKDGDSIVLDISTPALRNELIRIDNPSYLHGRLAALWLTQERDTGPFPRIEDIHSVDIELSHSTDPAVDNTVNIWSFQ